MLDPLIDADEFGVWINETLTPEQLPRAEQIISAASTSVRKYAGETWVDEHGNIVEDLDDAIPAVVKLVAARVWNNPTGLTSGTASPFASTWSEDAAELLKLTDTERAMISATLDKPSPGLFTISTTRGPLETAGPCSGDHTMVDTTYHGEAGEPILFGPETFA